jgi:SpoVK/Ycf46/Vps4 family AAA+-type ATPase
MGLEEFGTKVEVTPGGCEPALALNRSRRSRRGDEDEAPEGSAAELAVVDSQYTVCGNDEYVACPRTVKSLPSGLYGVHLSRGEIIYTKKDIKVDSLLKFPNGIADDILKEIESFWKKGLIFSKHGFLHRRGYLLYGPQGSGKTIIVQQVLKDILDKGGIAFVCGHPQLLTEGLVTFRKIEPNRSAVCVFEDIDSIVTTYGEDSLLTLLDGENQIDNVLNIATTNYPEKLDKRIVGRPRRFDRVLKIGMPPAEIRRLYFIEKLKLEDEDIEKWVANSEGFSFAALAELVISVKCLGNSFESSVETLKALMSSKVSSSEFDDPKKMGFDKFER